MRTLLGKRGVRVGFGGRQGGYEEAQKEVENLVRREGCEGYSGADLAALVREAGVIALKRMLGKLDALGMNHEQTGSVEGTERRADEEVGAENAEVQGVITVEVADFVCALGKVNPSVSVAQRRKYEALRNKFAGLPVRGGTGRAERVEMEKGGLGDGDNPGEAREQDAALA